MTGPNPSQTPSRAELIDTLYRVIEFNASRTTDDPREIPYMAGEGVKATFREMAVDAVETLSTRAGQSRDSLAYMLAVRCFRREHASASSAVNDLLERFESLPDGAADQLRQASEILDAPGAGSLENEANCLIEQKWLRVAHRVLNAYETAMGRTLFETG